MRHLLSLRQSDRVVGLLLVLAVMAGGLGLTQVLAADPGLSRAEPATIGEEIAAGPLRLTVAEVLTGEAATQRVLEASTNNAGPREGFTYVVIRLSVTNGSERPVPLDGNDFALTGASGLVRRFVGAQPPDPPIDGLIPPGESREGWVVLGAPTDETDLLLLFDSLALAGNWADRVVALEDGAVVADRTEPVAEPDTAGTDPADPLGLGDPATTVEWQIELLEVASCQEVFDLSDYRVQALTSEDADDEAPWLALKVRVTNAQAGGHPAFLSPTAFMLVNAEGETVSDVLALTAPYPDASGTYYPGATREGWVAFEIPETYADTGLTLVRFLPNRFAAEDARYLTYGEEWQDCRR